MGSSRNSPRPGRNKLKRSIVDQLNKAISETEGTTSADDENIHRVRRRCKRVRANLRLLRVAAPRKSRKAANEVRDASAVLSPYRDAQIIPTSLARVRSLMEQRFDVDAFSQVTEVLSESVTQFVDPDQPLFSACAKATDHLARARDLVSSIQLRSNRKMTAKVLAEVYRKGRQSVHQTLRSGDAEAYHQLRKHVKSHLYQCRFMNPAYRLELTAHIELAEQLGDRLGEAQDVAVLQQRCELVAKQIDPAQAKNFIDCCDQLAQQLRAEATCLACRLFFLKPRQFVAKLEASR